MRIPSAVHEPSGRSADFQSAVSPICNRQRVEEFLPAGSGQGAAECNSAIQPITNRRYIKASAVHGPNACARRKEASREPERGACVSPAQNNAPQPVIPALGSFRASGQAGCLPYIGAGCFTSGLRCRTTPGFLIGLLVAGILGLAQLELEAAASRAKTLQLTRAQYVDRVQAVWTAQIVAVLLAWPHEHQTASTLWLEEFPKPYAYAPVDDDWYYEMVAVRGFEKYGIGMTVGQLGAQWRENACGSWGSSEQARLNLARGIAAPDSGHPRYNKLWFTIGPQFSSDVYGALAPGMPNLAGKLAREFGHVNGYAEGTDGAVFMAAMVSLAFAERDPRVIVRQAATLIHPDSPYRKCLDLVITLAGRGNSFEEIADAIEDRWHIEYPATNNAVSNGGLVALCVWFGEGDFLKTVNLAARAADFTDADCNAANAAAVIGAMHGMKCLPPKLVAQLGDRIKGEKMGPVTLTPPVDESISGVAQRTAAIGERFLLANGAARNGETFSIAPEEPITQPAELFQLADLMRYWNPDWKLDRAGFGGAGGGMGGIRGITCLDGDVLATYPRDEIRGVVLRRSLKLSERPSLSIQAGVDAGRAWELNVYCQNKLMTKRILDGAGGNERKWEEIKIDLEEFAGQRAALRIYQRVLVPNRVAGNAYWKALRID